VRMRSCTRISRRTITNGMRSSRRSGRKRKMVANNLWVRVVALVRIRSSLRRRFAPHSKRVPSLDQTRLRPPKRSTKQLIHPRMPSWRRRKRRKQQHRKKWTRLKERSAARRKPRKRCQSSPIKQRKTRKMRVDARAPVRKSC